MITLRTTSQALHQTAAEAFIIILTKEECENQLSSNLQETLTSIWKEDPLAIFKAHSFEGNKQELFSHIGKYNDQLIPVICVGVGSLHTLSSDAAGEVLRRCVGKALNLAKATKKNAFSLSFSDTALLPLTRAEVVHNVTIIAHLISYEFNDFKSNKKGSVGEGWSPEITLVNAQAEDEQTIKQATIIGKSLNTTRRLADTPGNHMTPTILAEKAERIAHDHGLLYTVFGEEKAETLGMGCFLAVSRGSAQPGKFVTLVYEPDNMSPSTPTIALVGKGVCFDTGGISLKPAQYMSGMKYDMSGAAAVIGALQAVAQFKPSVRVVGVTPLVENMPDGNATKQDDVVTAMNGKTVEIDNTDAEGRLILADALCYAQKEYNPDVIIDIATLTGACMYALGPFYSGLFTRDEKLSSELVALGKKVGEKVWPLPLTDEYKPSLDSFAADIRNTGLPPYKAGATTAAIFLEHFIEENRRWAHLDIAGTDNNIPDNVYYGRGSTGVGVRLLLSFILEYKR